MCFTPRSVGPGPSIDHWYKVFYNFSKRRIEMYIDGKWMATTDFDPFAPFAWSEPLNNELFAETTHCATDTIGTRDDAAHFTGISKSTADKTWTYVSDLKADAAGGCGRYFSKWGDFPRLFYVWTYPL